MRSRGSKFRMIDAPSGQASIQVLEYYNEFVLLSKGFIFTQDVPCAVLRGPGGDLV